jgi:hypothetical protein
LLEAVVGRAVRHASVALDAAEPSRGPAVEALDRVIAAGWSELDRHSTIADAAAEQLSPAALTRAPTERVGSESETSSSAVAARGPSAPTFRLIARRRVLRAHACLR